jgi:hypothetical protein
MPKHEELTLEHKEYLGDGLYAGFDGYYLYLNTPRGDGEHWVALEPAVFHALLDYAARMVAYAGRDFADETEAVKRLRATTKRWRDERP